MNRTTQAFPIPLGEGALLWTVTHMFIGRVHAITPEFVALTDAAWVSDTGRLTQALETGVPGEVEALGDEVAYVSREGLILVRPWQHALPLAQRPAAR